MTPPWMLFLQAAAVAAPVDLSLVLIGGVSLIVTGLLGLVVWFLKRLVASLDGFKRETRDAMVAMRRKQGDQQLELQAIRQELVGLDGRNGIKGTQRLQGRQLRRLSLTVTRLAAMSGVEPLEETDRDEEAA